VAAVVLAVLAVGAAVVVAQRPGPVDDIRIDTTTTEPTPEEVLRREIRALGLTGLVVSTEVGLVDLATGEVTPLRTPGDVLTASQSTALLDGRGGVYYLSHTPDPDEPRDRFGHTDLRHRDAEGNDVLVQEGAHSFALRADGALALSIVRQPTPDSGSDFQYDVVVQAPDGTRATWSPAPGGYHVSAWAGNRLIGLRDLEDTEARDAIVLDGPGQVRDLAHEGGVTAIGPDGTWAVVAGVAPGAVAPAAGEPAPPDRILDLATGAEVGTIDLGGTALAAGALAWAGDDRLAGAAAVDLAPGPDDVAWAGVVEELAVASVDGSVRITSRRRHTIADDRTYVPEDAWMGRDGTLFALARASGPSPGSHDGYVVWVCRAEEDVCDRRALPFGRSGAVTAVADPSRPAG
jgi:hypothetical protein